MEDIRYLFDITTDTNIIINSQKSLDEEITEFGLYYIDNDNQLKYQANVKDLSELNLNGKIKFLYATINRIYSHYCIHQIFQIKHIPLFKIKLERKYFGMNVAILNCDIEETDYDSFEEIKFAFCNVRLNEDINMSNCWLQIFSCYIEVCGEFLTSGNTLDIPYHIKVDELDFSANIFYHVNDGLDIYSFIKYSVDIKDYYNKLYLDDGFKKDLIKEGLLQHMYYADCYNTPYDRINLKNLEVQCLDLNYCQQKIEIHGIYKLLKIKYSPINDNANFQIVNSNDVRNLRIEAIGCILDMNFILDYQNLKYLTIKNGLEVEYLPDLSPLTHLINLDVADNKLKELPRLPDSIKIINVSNNNITSFYNIPTNLKTINFKGNPIGLCHEIFERIKIREDSTIYLNNRQILTLKEYAIGQFIKEETKYKTILEVSKYFDYKKLEDTSILRYMENNTLIENINDDCQFCEKCQRYTFRYRRINYDGNFSCCS